MIKTILIDDEAAALNVLSKKIEVYCEGIKVVAQCQSSKDGLLAIQAYKPDLVFLDIEMPWMNGFEMLECLGDQIDFNIVFVTAYDQYAIQAFKVKALDYLLKPVEKDDLISCINRVKSHIEKFDSKSLEELMQEINKNEGAKRMTVNSTEGMEILNLNDIIYCQAASNYTYIYTSNDRKIVVSKTLSEIEKSLNPNFFMRIHKSYNVNMNYVMRYSNIEGSELVLRNESKLPISRRKKNEVLEAISNLK